jgi:hypothetical protein
VKVELTKEEKKLVGRHSSPRWELDVVGYKGATNEILVIECKSFLDSRGVQWCELQDGHTSTRYKLFREPVLREVVLGRLVAQMTSEGRCAPNPTIRLGMMAGKVKSGDEELLPEHFAGNGWEFFGPEWLRDQLSQMSGRGYSNQVSAIVAKLLLRGEKGNSGAIGIASKAGNGGARTRWKQDAPLKLLVASNPKRPGSQAHVRFQSYFSPSATTLAGALAAGVRMDDIRNDVAKGFIELG